MEHKADELEIDIDSYLESRFNDKESVNINNVQIDVALQNDDKDRIHRTTQHILHNRYQNAGWNVTFVNTDSERGGGKHRTRTLIAIRLVPGGPEFFPIKHIKS